MCFKKTSSQSTSDFFNELWPNKPEEEDLIPPPSIYIYMCTLYKYTNTYMPRFNPFGFSGPSTCVCLSLSLSLFAIKIVANVRTLHVTNACDEHSHLHIMPHVCLYRSLYVCVHSYRGIKLLSKLVGLMWKGFLAYSRSYFARMNFPSNLFHAHSLACIISKVSQ